MRDVLIVLVLAGALGWAVWKKSPFTALMTYFWISFMNPHRFTWGFAYSLPLAMASAGVTFLVLFLQPGDVKRPKSAGFFLFLMLWMFITATNFTAMYPDWAWEQWNIVNKIFLMTALAMLLVNTKRRLWIFMFAIVIYIGLVGIKGAAFGVATGGQYKVWGPPETFLEDNNDLGLALVIILPLSYYIKDLFKKKWMTIFSLGTTFSIAMSALLTYSRGALLGLASVVFFIVIRSKHKVAIGLATVAIVAVGMNFLPQHWFDRMNSMKSYEEDRSAQMRLNSWITSFELAKARPLGGGFDCFSLEMYDLYSPNPELGRTLSGGASTAHSIYFEVLAYHGFGGLFLYLFSIGFVYLSLGRLERVFKKISQLEWISITSRATRISIIGFVVSGAFLSRGFFDLFWAIYALGVCLISYVNQGGWIRELQGDDIEDVELERPLSAPNA